MQETPNRRPPLIVRSPFAFVNLLYAPCAATGAIAGCYLAASLSGNWRPDSIVSGIGLTLGAAICGLPIIFVGLRQERAWRALNPVTERPVSR